ncbi:MAG: TPM domain-containing protein [Bacteroides sp.]|nr:TPM domain-containing protein [Bacteroides sp.]
MRIKFILFSLLLLLGSLCLPAKEYTIQEIPMVHLQDRTRYVSNPDGILSPSAVATMDSILFALEEKTGIQTLVVAVTGIEGGDCFDFAYRLGKEMGVGQKERDNGLVILLSTDERCIQFATGYGLEGVLPDAICKRIQNRYMVQHLGKDDWNTGMVEGIRAVNGYLDGSMENIGKEENEDGTILFIIMGVIFGSVILICLIIAFFGNRCPKCKKRHALQRVTSHVQSRKNGVITSEVIYICKYCGHQHITKEQSNDPHYRGPRGGGGIFVGGGGFGSGGGGFSGGSFGGGSFGGGGAGSRF